MKLLRGVFEKISSSAIEKLGLSASEQRLDSTHIISNIRTRGRLDLFANTITLFIKSLDKSLFSQIPKHIQQWHTREPEGWFDLGQVRQKTKLEELARYLYELITIFENDKEVKNSEPYQLLIRLFQQQCELKDETDSAGITNKRVKIKKKTNGNTLQSAYDPDAFYGHKGLGYSMHITETCNNTGKTEIITDYAMVQRGLILARYLHVLHQPQHHAGILCLTHNDIFPILLLTKKKFLSTRRIGMFDKKHCRIVVVGASAAGLRAAARARRCMPSAKVIVIDQGTVISYGACGMPYYVSGDIENADKLRETPYGIIRDPEFFRAAKDIEVITSTRVERIDRKAKKVFCISATTGEKSDYPYDKLVLATGASPMIPPGIPKEGKRISEFKTFENAVDLKKSIQMGEIETVGIVGGGFIGCELAEAFGSLWGADVILFDAAPTILASILDAEMAWGVEAYLKTEGVEIHTSCPLESITESEDGVIIEAKNGKFCVDHVVMAIGVKPNTNLAVDCGLNVGKAGGILVDEKMVTSDPDIFAAGDCVEVKHFVSGKALQLPLGSLANRQGRVVGSNLNGGKERFGKVVGSAAVKIFDINVAATGLTETSAREAGFNAGSVWGSFPDKADYFPESKNIHLKIIFDKDSSRLLGMQGYGPGEVVKRVDVFAALLKNEGTLEDLLDMEFAYAPPYAPAVDPLFSLGCAARNLLLEGVNAVSPQTSLNGAFVIDVRMTKEFENKPPLKGNVLNIPFEKLRENGKEIPRDKDLVCICSRGGRSAEALRILKEKGFSNISYMGGGILMIPDFGEE